MTVKQISMIKNYRPNTLNLFVQLHFKMQTKHIHILSSWDLREKNTSDSSLLLSHYFFCLFSWTMAFFLFCTFFFFFSVYRMQLFSVKTQCKNDWIIYMNNSTFQRSILLLFLRWKLKGLTALEILLQKHNTDNYTG